MAKEFKYNPDLQFIREDVPGNLCIDGQFVFGQEKDKLPFERLARWMMSPNPQRREKRKDTFLPTVISNKTFMSDARDKIVWLGHSSFYLQINGIRLLTDPVYYNLAPVRLPRKHKMPCSVADLVSIDYILLSHGHRDHLDLPSLRKILQYNPTIGVLCPLGFRKMLERAGFINIQEAAWWQRYNTPGLQIDFLPAKHWNRRHLFDYNTTLWGSFSIHDQTQRIYFAGDTGYDIHFKQIQDYYPQFDTCLMPVGAYKPHYIMEWAHTSPEDAVKGFHELNGKTFIPMHYGTFDLSDEPAGEPVRILKKMEHSEKLNGSLKILNVGEEFLLVN